MYDKMCFIIRSFNMLFICKSMSISTQQTLKAELKFRSSRTFIMKCKPELTYVVIRREVGIRKWT